MKNKGVYGNRVKIEPEEVDTMLRSDIKTFTQIGKVVGVGPEAKLQVGDRVVFVEWRASKVLMGDKEFYYTTDTPEFILEIL